MQKTCTSRLCRRGSSLVGCPYAQHVRLSLHFHCNSITLEVCPKTLGFYHLVCIQTNGYSFVVKRGFFFIPFPSPWYVDFLRSMVAQSSFGIRGRHTMSVSSVAGRFWIFFGSFIGSTVLCESASYIVLFFGMTMCMFSFTRVSLPVKVCTFFC